MEEENKKPNIEYAIKKAEEIAKKYNPETFIPFPFDVIEKEVGDLEIKIAKLKDDKLSGVLDYKNVDGTDKFRIFVNSSKPDSRIYFTIAHELGHYFLHREILKEKRLVVDSGDMVEMFRHDYALNTAEEKEANNFAAALIMPAERVREVWYMFKDIEKCAEFFQVSKLAMSIRLSILGLID